ncbi:hypothetical protein K435DRAFT_861779 [Dendrothele bispora CBS 962.96]|uniref:Uncharacterized protein n=1 Tax=Dendrothele bispora (strain CBS 962.96) TaxID=1314807 RepID=A0A4S8LUC8_DENBC|nr:hypothetical protein K435DRAFT_861775 [Dendrothele bispora CBS 962.96]THU93154.1 hypothetical protein K435DRAFT_861779 [Dendrothele bispora CBS 962.96]
MLENTPTVSEVPIPKTNQGTRWKYPSNYGNLTDLAQRMSSGIGRKHFCYIPLENSIEKSIHSNYITGAWDYIRFFTCYNLPLDPTPSLSCYVALTSHHTSASKYLIGACHYLKDLYPDFDDSHLSPLLITKVSVSHNTGRSSDHAADRDSANYKGS